MAPKRTPVLAALASPSPSLYCRPMSSDRAAPRLIALDWGTTSLRAYLLGDEGEVLERRSEPLGILQVRGGDFAGVLESVTTDWRSRDPDLPAIASGMVGSAQGWLEAPYVDVPADVGAIVRALATEPRSGLRIVPGLAQRGAAPDVMRGEETQLFGAMAGTGVQRRDAEGVRGSARAASF